MGFDINKLIMDSVNVINETAETTKEQKKIKDKETAIKPTANDSTLKDGVSSVARSGKIEESVEVDSIRQSIPAAICAGMGAITLRTKLSKLQG